MEKRILNYLNYLSEQSQHSMTQEEKDYFLADLLQQIAFFQHERLIHLIVTVTFALLTFITILCTLFSTNLILLLLILVLFLLLIPYLRHYYILENSVQKMYTYYDKWKRTLP